MPSPSDMILKPATEKKLIILIGEAIYRSVILRDEDDPEGRFWSWLRPIRTVDDFIKGHIEVGNLDEDNIVVITWKSAREAMVLNPKAHLKPEQWGIRREDGATLAMLSKVVKNTYGQELYQPTDQVGLRYARY